MCIKGNILQDCERQFIEDFFKILNIFAYIFRFRVDFYTPSGEIAFHINPRFDENCIVRNTEKEGWGQEERKGRFPLSQNTTFEMVITAESDHFNVKIDGSHAFDYRHRIPLDEVTVLSIEGGVECHDVSFFKN